jgi:hypothetical protein
VEEQAEELNHSFEKGAYVHLVSDAKMQYRKLVEITFRKSWGAVKVKTQVPYPP